MYRFAVLSFPALGDTKNHKKILKIENFPRYGPQASKREDNQRDLALHREWTRRRHDQLQEEEVKGW